ncbi:MAG: hypothetical protein JXA74_02535 [Anaerolineae bacterium]|nr:hypothetical protein [Anaerolineae bacterium]
MVRKRSLWLAGALLALAMSAWGTAAPAADESCQAESHRLQAQPCDVVVTTYSADYYSLDTVVCGQMVAEGTVINAYDPQGVCCGTTIARAGEWGIMAVYGDDPDTPADEGAETDDQISFTLDGWPAMVVSGDARWRDMARREVALRVDTSPPCTPSPSDTPPETPTVTPSPSVAPTATGKPALRVLLPLVLR